MDLYNTIPFGLSTETGELVGVHEVERGRACGCICPSCRTPLVSRKGDDRIWHFAHETRGTFNTTQEPCDYSLFVALKLMARQIFRDARAIALPELQMTRTKGSHRRTELVTPERRVELLAVEIESSVAGFAVDAAMTVAGPSTSESSQGQIGIYLSYAGHEFPAFDLLEAALVKARTGVLELDLRKVIPIYIREAHQRSVNGFKQTYQKFLLESTEGRVWRFHPRSVLTQQRLDRELSLLPEAPVFRWPSEKAPYPSSVPRSTARSPDGGPTWFGCRSCRVRWICIPEGRIHCPNCRLDYHVRYIGPADVHDFGRVSTQPWAELQ